MQKKHNIPIVATNDCYFVDKENYKAQDILSCIINKNAETDLKRERRTPEHYIKTQEEMIELFADIPEAINNTINIAKRISTMAYNRKPTLPHFPLPEGQTEQQYMRKLSEDGLTEKLKQKFINENITDEAKQEEIKKIYFDRLDYEINIIETMDFSGYFLIVSDFIIWSKKNGVPVGPGRGSGAGSVVAWSLKITGVDPINFNISFERFLNPERISMPDFDIDFCQEGRGRSVEYVQNKYGKELVSQIVTFGKLQAKAVIKDVGRILQFGYEFTDALSKRIPEGAKGEGGKSPLQTALDNDQELQKEMQIDPQISEILDISLQLEELSRHSSVHAAGVVIGDKPLREICPLYFAEDADMQTIQYTMKYAEEVGLVKFDFLGLSTLTVIKDVLEDLQARNVYIDIDNIPLNIAGVFEMLGDGNVVGVFQLESSGMKTTTKQMRPDRITDISALVALYRPGPMGQIPHYIARKNGTEEIKCLHPKMLEILSDTYGVIVYQDQVMNLAKGLAGYTMGGADMLRRAMGKKVKEQMDDQREFFVKGGTIKTTLFGKEVEQEIIGCEKNGIDNDTANKIFDAMAEFASYGFNLAHATAYGIIGYQTAYLKYFFPVEFAVATINDRINNTDNVAMCIQDLRQRDYKILMPDINVSDIYFTTECIGEKRTFESLSKDKPNDYDFDAIRADNVNYGVRYGLAGIKGLGANVGELIIAERDENGKFKDIFDFISRFNTKVINKKTLEALTKAGAFESIHKNRRQIHDSIEEIIKINAGDLEEKNTKQLNFFDAIDVGEQSLKRLPTMSDWNEADKIEKEFEAFGFYIEGHPLEKVIDELKAKDVVFSNELSEKENDDRIIMTGILLSKNTKKGKNGKYLLLKLSDPVGIIELFIFGDDLIAKNRELLEEQKHNKLALSIHLRKDETGEVRLNANGIAKLEDFLSGEAELGNPLSKIIPQLRAKNIKFSNELRELDDKDTFFAAGIVETVKSRQGAKGEYLFVSVGDAKGEINFSVFNEEMVRSSYFDEKQHTALALACQVSKDAAGRNRYNITAMCLLEDFLGGKEEIKLRRKFSGNWNGGNSWSGGNNYRTQGVEIVGEKKSEVIKELYIVISTPQQMTDVKTIINTTKKEGETEYTKIVLDVGLSKIEIPGCQIKEDDLERIKNVRGIIVK
ncbi:MAG: DNA polymerase III subunit alpha [Rickettsiales bacterium]|nr:MAG: DNA polymerase III subunit alpha [Rickettsiales bacterium]